MVQKVANAHRCRLKLLSIAFWTHRTWVNWATLYLMRWLRKLQVRLEWIPSETIEHKRNGIALFFTDHNGIRIECTIYFHHYNMSCKVVRCPCECKSKQCNSFRCAKYLSKSFNIQKTLSKDCCWTFVPEEKNISAIFLFVRLTG